MIQMENILKHLKKIRMPKDYFYRYPEAILRLNYAMARFVKAEIGLKIKQDDPRVYFTAKHIPEKRQIALHLRMPVKDEWNNIIDFLDIDFYFPETEIKKIEELIEKG